MVDKLTGLRGVAEAAFEAAVHSADPEEAVHASLRIKDDVLKVGDVDYFLARFRRVFVIGAGKASARMARALERILGPRLSGGMVITTRGQASRAGGVLVREGSHPLPDHDSLTATEELLEFVSDFDERDLVLCVISGGGSALLTRPVEGVSITDLERANHVMLESGMDINEINMVRKRLSVVKGGGLARMVHPATLVSLILSDVVGDKLETIASGPTVRDRATADEAIEALERHGVLDRMPEHVLKGMSAPARHPLLDGGAGDDEVFARVQNIIIGSNRIAVEAAAARAKRLGMSVMVLTSSLTGESREAAKFFGALAREVRRHGSPLEPPACLIAGGETTVTKRGEGKGGRCQEMALAVALELHDVPGAVFLAAGTDGVDGPTDAAGAIADSNTLKRALPAGLDPRKFLDENDSHSFFQNLDDLVKTGPTGTNVMDIHVLLVG